MSRADIGIAMGAMGSDAAIEAADVVLMDDDPMKIAKAIRISRKCLRIVHENIVFAIGIKLLCLLLGALGMDAVVVGKGNILLPQIQALGADGIGLVFHKNVGLLINDKRRQAHRNQGHHNGKGHEDRNHRILFHVLFLRYADYLLS